jgi:hypothetical protein
MFKAGGQITSPRLMSCVVVGASLCTLTILWMSNPSRSQATQPVGVSRDTAHAARTFSLNENGNLRLTSKQGFTLNEQGPASGTVSATIYVHLKIVSSTRVSAEIDIYPHGGSITCQGSAGYKRQGASASFSGSLSIERGTGGYAHAHGTGLSFDGTIQRSNDAVTVHVGGTASD